VSAGELPAGLGEMNIDQLRTTWTQLVGGPVPKLRARELMALALAYRLQARIHGDLPGPLKRKLAELGRRFTEDRSYTPVPGPALKPGCSLIKDWRGVRHEVRVLEEGFSYQGVRFGSLSEVARRITGTKWNGQVFFGLKARRR
jgi:hypothetical protein